jgi:hypothetical protein
MYFLLTLKNKFKKKVEYVIGDFAKTSKIVSFISVYNKNSLAQSNLL